MPEGLGDAMSVSLQSMTWKAGLFCSKMCAVSSADHFHVIEMCVHDCCGSLGLQYLPSAAITHSSVDLEECMQVCVPLVQAS